MYYKCYFDFDNFNWREGARISKERLDNAGLSWLAKSTLEDWCEGELGELPEECDIDDYMDYQAEDDALEYVKDNVYNIMDTDAGDVYDWLVDNCIDFDDFTTWWKDEELYDNFNAEVYEWYMQHYLEYKARDYDAPFWWEPDDGRDMVECDFVPDYVLEGDDYDFGVNNNVWECICMDCYAEKVGSI